MRERLHRIWSLVIKELLQLRRDRLLVGFVILGPLIELALMGNLVGGGVENLALAVVDLDYTRASRELVGQLEQTDELRVWSYGDSVGAARESMGDGNVSAILVVPPGYGDQLADPRHSVEIQVIADDANYVVYTVAVATVERVASNVARELVARYGGRGIGGIDLRFISRFNATLDGRPGAITAMLGLIVYQVTLVIAAQSFTRERELGTLEQLRITPLGRLEMIIGKAIPTLVIGLIDGLLMTGVIILWFEVPMRGSLLLLLLLTVPFVLAQIGWGTLISLVSQTQQQSVLFVFALSMLEVACSGFIVPASDMPDVMRVVSYASSVQHYLVILRGVMLRGAGLGELWQPVLSLMGIASLALAFAWLRLRMGLDSVSLRRRLQGLRDLLCRRRTTEAEPLADSPVKPERREPSWTREPA